MNSIKEIGEAINFLIVELQKKQQTDGSFRSISSPTINSFTAGNVYTTLFTTSIIISSLAPLKTQPEVKLILTKAENFLLKNKSKNWSWNYWPRNSMEEHIFPYPDDLDDTFCALIALSKIDSQIITGTVLAHIVHLLTYTEIKEGGPYTTWLIQKREGLNSTLFPTLFAQQVDLAVNCNIAFFLKKYEIHLPPLITYIENHIKRGTFNSRYYPTPYPILYFITRWYQGPYQYKLVDFLKKHQKSNGSFGDMLSTLLGVNSLIQTGVAKNDIKKSISYILNQYKTDVLKPYPFCIDPYQNNLKYYNGSTSLTISLCIETLALYVNKYTTTHIKSHSDIHTKDTRTKKLTKKIYDDILKSVLNMVKPYDYDKKISSVIYSLNSKDSQQEITLLPLLFYTSLDQKLIHRNSKRLKPTLITKQHLTLLGSANLSGWVAYTIVDDFLDRQPKPLLLPGAMACLRNTVGIYTTFITTTKESDFIENVFNKIDEANIWEQIHCRFDIQDTIKVLRLPKYTDDTRIAHKSLGHALSPIAILFLSGFKSTSREVIITLHFFEHYLTARQLNDDAHDWLEDLKQGIFNPVNVLVVSYAKKKFPHKSISTISNQYLEELYWNKIIPHILKRIEDQLSYAERACHQLTIMNDKYYFMNLLQPLKNATYKARTEREKMISFIKEY